MKVFVLMGSDTETPWVAHVFIDRARAEETMRFLNEQGKSYGYEYTIKEMEVTE
jgi:hypothetical protein